ncbi:5522_t:CDS:2, partial [Scutellospora calospora]
YKRKNPNLVPFNQIPQCLYNIDYCSIEERAEEHLKRRNPVELELNQKPMTIEENLSRNRVNEEEPI